MVQGSIITGFTTTRIARKVGRGNRKPKSRAPVTKKLPTRTADTMSEAIALSSPSGRMSKAARTRAEKRLAKSLFGEGGLQRGEVPQPSEELVLRRQAIQLRGLADRGMSPKKNRAAASKLEDRASTLSQRQLDRS